MKALLAATALAVSCTLLASAASAAQRPVACKLVVKGKTYLDGVCQFEADKDGSFRIFGKDYFAYVNVFGKTAEASWNADPQSTHAQAPLGKLTRKGACWVSATVQICARSLSPAKLAAAMAAQPQGEMINPDFPGASQSCVVAKGSKWAQGVPLVLDTCPGDRSANRFVRAGGEMRIDKAPGLCVGLAVGAHRATVVLETCVEATRKWTSDATGATSGLIRSNMNDCWAIPDLANEKAKFPFAVEAVDCKGGNPKPVKFLFEKN